VKPAIGCAISPATTFKDRAKDSISANDITEALKGLKSTRFSTFLDVNFKGFVDKGDKLAIAEPTLGKAPYREFLGDDGSDDHAPLPGRVVFLATASLTPTLEVDGKGLFTKVITDGLRGAADEDKGTADGKASDGLVTVEELTRYLETKLPELARTVGKTEKEKQQFPFVMGSRARYVLAYNPTLHKAAVARVAKFEALVKGGKLKDKEQIERGRTYLDRMPLLEADRKLRKAYETLVDAGEAGLPDFETAWATYKDAIKLTVKEARDYALKVVEVVTLIKDAYVRPVEPGDMVRWAVEGLYRQVDLPVPEKIKEKLADPKKLDDRGLFELLVEARQHLGKREDLEKQKDLSITLQRMLHKLDPYTTYIDPETLKKFRQDVTGHFTGIGIQIRKDANTDQLLVVSPIKGSPAYKAGLQAGDLITHVIREKDSDDKPLPENEKVLETKGLGISKAVKLILGTKGTDVTLRVVREGKDKPFEVTIQRGQVIVESVLGHVRKEDDSWDWMIDSRSKIAYIRLTNFAEFSAAEMEKAVKEVVGQGVKGLILDLRNNPGGRLDAAIKITDLFIDDGLIVRIKPRVGREARYSGRSQGSQLGFPMVCLINGNSASGSEILSAALQDHDRAVIMGERSYGKGTVQNIQDYEEGEIKLTTASFWRPNGKNINKYAAEKDFKAAGVTDPNEWGISADKEIKLTPKDHDDLFEAQRNAEIIEPKNKRGKLTKTDFKDKQLESAVEFLRGQIKMASRIPGAKGE